MNKILIIILGLIIAVSFAACEDSSSAAARVLEEIENESVDNIDEGDGDDSGEGAEPGEGDGDDSGEGTEPGEGDGDDSGEGSVPDDNSSEEEKAEYVAEKNEEIFSVIEQLAVSSTTDENGDTEYEIEKGETVVFEPFPLTGYSLYLKVRLEGTHASGAKTRDVWIESIDEEGAFIEVLDSRAVTFVKDGGTVEEIWFDIPAGVNFALRFDGGSGPVWIVKDIQIVNN